MPPIHLAWGGGLIRGGLINEDDKGALVPAIHSHLVRVQWAQAEASSPKSGLSYLLKIQRVEKFLMLSDPPRQERKDKNILIH